MAEIIGKLAAHKIAATGELRLSAEEGEEWATIQVRSNGRLITSTDEGERTSKTWQQWLGRPRTTARAEGLTASGVPIEVRDTDHNFLCWGPTRLICSNPNAISILWDEQEGRRQDIRDLELRRGASIRAIMSGDERTLVAISGEHINWSIDQGPFSFTTLEKRPSSPVLLGLTTLLVISNNSLHEIDLVSGEVTPGKIQHLNPFQIGVDHETSYLAALTNDGIAIVYDLSSGEELARTEFEDTCFDIEWEPEGHRLRLRKSRFSTSNEVWDFRTQDGPIEYDDKVRFIPGSDDVLVCGDPITVCDKTGKLVRELKIAGYWLELLPDGEHFVADDGNRIRLVEIQSGKVLAELKMQNWPTGRSIRFAIHPTGNRIAVRNGTQLQFYDLP